MRVEVPADMPGITGIFLGGCVERGVGSSFRATAHAHCVPGHRCWGWLCFRSIRALGRVEIVANSDGTETVTILTPSATLWHEYAHLLAPGHWHDEYYRTKLRGLAEHYGGQAKRAYNQAVRNRDRVASRRKAAPSGRE